MRLEAICAARGRPLVERLTAYPRFVRREADGWIHPKLRPAVLKLADSEGLGRDCAWSPGLAEPALGTPRAVLGPIHDGPTAPELHRIIDRAANGQELSEAQAERTIAGWLKDHPDAENLFPSRVGGKRTDGVSAKG